MSNPKGTRFETSLLPELQLFYPHAERRARTGAKDKGDFVLPGESRYILEAKNVTRFNLPEWLRQAETEARNAGALYGVVVHKRRGTALPGDQWVTMTLRTFLSLCAR